MSKNNVVSIKAHPQYRDVAALRRYLAEGQDDFDTPVYISHILDLKAPELQEQLSELNAWAEALQGLTPISISAPTDEPVIQMDFSHYTGRTPGKSLSTDKMLNIMFPGGLKKGDFYNHAAIVPWPLDRTPLHHMSRNQDFATIPKSAAYDIVREGVNIVIENKMQYLVRKHDDANPST